jgi:hypothetical protein
MLLFPQVQDQYVPEYVGQVLIGFFTIFNVLIGPREFRVCKKIKGIIKIEKIE